MVVTFTSRVNFMNENKLPEPKVSKSLYILLCDKTQVQNQMVYFLINIYTLLEIRSLLWCSMYIC